MMREKEEEENCWMDLCMQNALQSRMDKANLRRLRYSSSSSSSRSNSTATHNSSTTSRSHDDNFAAAAAATVSAAAESSSPIMMMDFSSNDYLGLAHSPEQHALVKRMYAQECSSLLYNSSSSPPLLGSTGSRLLSGDAPHFHVLEDYLANVHLRPAALLCNSGYDANLSVVSSLPADVLVYDEYVHNSLHMGMRLWKSMTTQSSSTAASKRRKMAPFQHNSVSDLERVLQEISASTNRRRRVVVLVESVYSMDGDIAPLKEMLNVAQRYNAVVVVDEAHGLGVFGRKQAEAAAAPLNNQANNDDDNINMTKNNKSAALSSLLQKPPPPPPPLCRGGTGVLAQYELEDHPALLCSIHTFGKAPGCHGAVVCCRHELVKDYLVNFAYPFIYSTALPLHAVVAIRASYETFTGRRGDELRARLFELVQLFQGLLSSILPIGDDDAKRQRGGGGGGGGDDDDDDAKPVFLLPSTSPIQALMISGNARCADFCQRLYQTSSKRQRRPVLLYPIKSPTVPVGQERVRIILHAHNTSHEVHGLCRLIQFTLQEMGLLHLPTTTKSVISSGDNFGHRSKL